MRRSRWLRVAVYLSLGLILIAAIILGVLSTSYPSRSVERSLSGKFGAIVTIGSVSPGFVGSTLTDLGIRETAESEPWVTVGDVEADVSIFSALFGSGQPKKLDLRKAFLRLRFNRNGDLLTQLPKPPDSETDPEFPEIRISEGEVVLQQEGRADSTFRNVALTLTPQDGQLRLDGSIDDPVWKRWTADGLIQPSGVIGKANLKTEVAIPIRQAMLDGLPFVNPNVWKQVQLDGETTGELKFDFSGRDDRFKCDVDLEPIRTELLVRKINLQTQGMTGQIGIRDDLVTLKNIEGQAAGGKLKLDAVLDFRTSDSLLRFEKIIAEKVRLTRLPKGFGLSPLIDGLLTGSGTITLLLPETGGIGTDGTGEATVTDTKFGGLPVSPIKVTMKPSANGFTFGSEPIRKTDPPAKKEPVDEKKNDPAPPVPKKLGSLPSQILKWYVWVLSQKDDAAPKDSLTLTVNLKDIELGELLKKVEVPLTVRVAGKISTDTELFIPTNTPDDFKTWTIRGKLTSPRLVIEDLPIDDVTADFRYQKSVLNLLSLTGKPDSAGALSLSGTIATEGEYPFSLKADVRDLAMDRLTSGGALLPINITGKISGNVTAAGTASPQNLRSLAGKVTSPELVVGILPLKDFSADFATLENRLKIQKAQGEVGGGTITAEGEIPLVASETGTLTIKLDALELAEITKKLPATTKLRIEGKASGSIVSKIPAVKEGEKRVWPIEGEITAPKLKFQNLPAEKVRAKATWQDGSVKYSLDGDTLGGQFSVNGQYPPPKERKEPPTSGRFRLTNIRLARLWEPLRIPSLKGLNGILSVELPFDIDDDAEVTGAGTFRIERVRYKNSELSPRISGIIRVTRQQLRFDEVYAPLGEGSIRARVVLNRLNFDRSRTTIMLDHVPAKQLAFLYPEIADELDFSVDGRLSGTLGRESRGSGTVIIPRGKAFGAPISDVRLPLDWTFAQKFGRGELMIRDISGRVGGGRVTGKTEFTYSADLPNQLESEFTFGGVNLGSIVRSTDNYTGGNTLNGKLILNSRELRTKEDLTGTLKADFGESQPFQLPVLSQILPFLGASRSRNTGTERGEIRATLGKGVWRVQRLVLAGRSVNLFMDGTITLGGRLDLEVVATTNNTLLDPRILKLLGLRIPGAGAIPLTLALDVSRYLANRTVHLSVGGTIENPAIRLKPFETLRDEAIRFFLGSALPEINPQK